MDIGVVIVYLIVCGGTLVLYFLPTAIALYRGVHNVGPLIVINIFFGWTFIGWVVALAWSFTAVRPRFQIPSRTAPNTSFDFLNDQ